MSDHNAAMLEFRSQFGPRSAHAIAFAWLEAIMSDSPKARHLSAPNLKVGRIRADLQRLGFDRHPGWGVLRGNATENAGEACVAFLAGDYRDAYDRAGFCAVPAGGVLFITLRRHGPQHARRWRVTAIDTNNRGVDDA